MADWTNLKTEITKVIKANGNQEITGQLLQNALLRIVDSVGAGATFMGLAVPDTNPGVPDGPVFYIATSAGEYMHFSGMHLGNNDSSILCWRDGEWTKTSLGLATNSAVDKVQSSVEAESQRAQKAENDLQKAITDNASALADTQDNVSAVSQKVNTNATDIATLKPALKALESEVDLNTESINATKTEITDLQAATSKNAESIANNKGSITTLQAGLATNTQEVKKLDNDFTVLQSNVESDITKMQRSISLNTDAVSKAVSAVNNMEPRVAGIEEVQYNNTNDVIQIKANAGFNEYEEFSPAKDYAIGDIVRHEGLLYQFTKAHTYGPWLGSDNVQTSFRTIGAAQIEALRNIEERFKALLGYRAERSIVNIEPDITGKYVECESRSAKANSKFAISKPIQIDACSEILIKTGFNPSDDTHKALDLSIISIYEETERKRQVQKTNEVGQPLYYVVVTDETTGEITVTTDETTDDTGYPVYVVEVYTEVKYLPNNEDRFVAIPDSGYYVANMPLACKVVISYKPGVSDTAIIIEKHGALASLVSQVLGIYEHRTMAEALVSIATRVEALESRQGLLGNATARTLDALEFTRYLYPTVLLGHGAPSPDSRPDNIAEDLPWRGSPIFAGQLYVDLDASKSGLYYAVNLNSVAGWKLT